MRVAHTALPRDVVWTRMSNHRITSATIQIAVRLPKHEHAILAARGPIATQVVDIVRAALAPPLPAAAVRHQDNPDA
jgi:hypothetical protein